MAEFDSDDDEEDRTEHEQEVIDIENPPSKKPRKVQYDMTYRFPSRQTLSAISIMQTLPTSLFRMKSCWT